ncbi:unnamed protein product [Lymnaea stagnalis]|uniref:Uncharacterized protein n=1 Tax=Lymnaea stagnalis TaxID=6523 RepID=A0AAV2H670_LYMST
MSIARGSLKHSVYIDRNLQPPKHPWPVRPHEKSKTWPCSLRQYGIDDYLNNYTMSVDDMSKVDPLPVLTPINLFPDPYLEAVLRPRYLDSVGNWPCQLHSDLLTRCPVKTRFPYPGRDWFRKWAEYMYVIGEFGAKTQK